MRHPKLPGLLVAALWSCQTLPAAELAISPNPVTDCADGLGRATLRWSGAAGPVEIRVGDPSGPPLTGPAQPPDGEVQTDYWITAGMRFVLVSSNGGIEAIATARLDCSGSSQLEPVYRMGSFLPLQIGNTWVYRVNTRSVTSSYVTRTVHHTERIGGVTWFVLSDDGQPVLRVRNDSEGRIWTLKGTPENPREELLLDPAALRRVPFSNSLGSFPEAVTRTSVEGLLRREQVYVRGIGLARAESILMAGSSGGFMEGWDLVEARLDGIRLSLPVPRISIGLESTTLDVSGRRVANCAVPSYCPACGLIGADLPGTYKPCFQAQVEASATTPYKLVIQLADAAGKVVFRASPVEGLTGETVRYVQVRLYDSPNVPLPPGPYNLVAWLESDTAILAASTLAVRLQ